jgi:uncharacterized protein YjbI with pentapeptide repeats
MANDQHVAVLNQGVAAWIAWCEENPDIRPELDEADLRGANLRGAVLNEACLNEAHLNGAILAGANLNGANLEEADLSGADLNGANLTSTAYLRGASCDLCAKEFEIFSRSLSDKRPC